MEVLAVSHEREGLCGGENNCSKVEGHRRTKTTDCVKANENKDESEYSKGRKSDTTAAVCGKSESLGFFRRTLKSVLKIERNNSTGSYDMECLSTRSSTKEGYFSENDDRYDGVDSGIASEASDGPASSRLSSCTNYTRTRPELRQESVMYLTEMRLEILVRWSCPILWKMLSEFKELYHDVSFDFISLDDIDGSSFGDRVPGLSGIHNLGNTCYMNAVLQCLAHIDTVVEYFALGKYRDDLKQRRTIFRARKMEKYHKGKLTEHFAKLLKSLWTFGYSKELSQDFKDAVSKCGEQYSGTAQQDAQEFLLRLLDYLHEDLCKNRGSSSHNRSLVTKKKKHCSEEEQAARTLATHSSQNRSFIKSVFQAQYKSSIICPNCGKYSSTFDPFLCISLPIPQKDTKPLYIIIMCSSYNEHPVKIGVNVPYSGTVRDLRSIVSKRINVSEERLILLLAYDDGDHSSLHDESMIDAIPEMDNCLFALEAPSENDVKVMPGTRFFRSEKPAEPTSSNDASSHVDGLAANFSKRVQPCSVTGEKNTIAVIVTNCELKDRRSRRFGFPIIFRVSKDISFKDLQLLIRREMPQEVRNTINAEARNWKLVLGIRVVGGLINNEFLKETSSGPLRSQTVERGILTSLTAGPSHVSLIAEWEAECPDWCLAKFGLGYAQEDPTVKQLEEEFCKSQSVHLSECLELHTKEENLHYDEAWKCPSCKEGAKETTKRLTLWSLPDILVFHLKRFQQANQWKGKISAEVEFPLSGLDMRPHLAERSKMSEDIAKKFLNSKRHLYTPPPENEDCVYDLFAVCNHIGPYITSGHYTASCRNSANDVWYCFDDANVYELAEAQVCTRSAYLMFYKKRNRVLRSESLRSVSSINSHWSELISEADLDAFDER